MKHRGFTTGWKRAAVAAALAYALVLQGLLLSLGGALHAAQASGPRRSSAPRAPPATGIAAPA
jgi:hypothetical protein